MAVVQRQWCSWDNDLGTVYYTYDDVSLIVQSMGWVNNSTQGQSLIMILLPGNTPAALSGNINSIPTTALVCPIPSGSALVVDDGSGNPQTFTTSKAASVGATSISVSHQAVSGTIASGAVLSVTMPTLTVPPQGQTAAEPSPYNVTLGSTASQSLSNFNIPMQTGTSHGIQFLYPPAILICSG